MDARTRLQTLQRLWAQEQAAARARNDEALRETPLNQRVERGEALKRVLVEEVEAAAGGRSLLWVSLPEGPELRLRPGAPLRLWWTSPDDAEERVHATAARLSRRRLGLMVDGDPPERLLTGAFNIDRDDPQATFQRGARAIEACLAASPNEDLGRLREVLFGGARPQFDIPRDWRPLDDALNAGQRTVVAYALSAFDLCLVHGPPGTGKTRTLIEIARQAADRGERVLCCAMSNTAVDHLAAGLHEAGVPLLRLGHPARVAEALEARSLDRLLEGDEAHRLARQWMTEARQLREKALRRKERGSLERAEFRTLMGEARRLQADARAQLRRAQQALIERSPVVCATAAGADSDLLREHHFDLLVLDEATQAPDPIALVAIAHARRLVLAGDHEQLPPTIIDPRAEAGGLGTTLFDRLARTTPEASRMLSTQYRMHADLMAFPSVTRYEGKLVAAPEVAAHRLEDLGVRPDESRATPLILVDTAGKGWEDRADESGSWFNQAQAARCVAEVRRLLSRGLAPEQVSVITPYNAQRALLRAELGAVEVSTVDGFQGRENEAVVVDLVRSNALGKVGFVKDRRRLNVALTRARRLLMVIADTATLGQHPDFARFLEEVEARGTWLSAWADEAEPLE